MDPVACYRDLLGAVADREWHAARELGGALLLWLDRGGFGLEGMTRAETRGAVLGLLVISRILQNPARGALDSSVPNPNTTD